MYRFKVTANKRNPVSEIAKDIALLSNYFNTGFMLINRMTIAKRFTIQGDIIKYGMGTTTQTLTASTSDSFGGAPYPLALKSMTQIYSNQRYLGLFSQYSVVANGFNSAVLNNVPSSGVSWLNTCHIAYGNPGSVNYRIMGPAQEVNLSYERTPQIDKASSNSATYGLTAPVNKRWHKMNYMYVGVNQSDEGLNIVNCSDSSITVFDTTIDITVDLAGVLIWGATVADTDALRTVLRTLGYNGTPWLASEVQLALDGIIPESSVNSITNGPNNDWRENLLQLVINGTQFIDNTMPDKVRIHRIVNRVAFSDSGTTTIPAPTGTNLYGVGVSGTFKGSLYNVAQSRLRTIFTKGCFLSGIPGNTAIGVWYRGQAGSSTGYEIANIDRHGTFGSNFDLVAATTNTAATAVLYAKYLEQKHFLPLYEPIYMGALESDETFYMISSYTSDQSVSAGTSLMLDGVGLEFIDANTAQQFDDFVAAKKLLPMPGRPVNMRSLEYFNG